MYMGYVCLCHLNSSSSPRKHGRPRCSPETSVAGGVSANTHDLTKHILSIFFTVTLRKNAKNSSSTLLKYQQIVTKTFTLFLQENIGQGLQK